MSIICASESHSVKNVKNHYKVDKNQPRVEFTIDGSDGCAASWWETNCNRIVAIADAWEVEVEVGGGGGCCGRGGAGLLCLRG